MYAVVMGNSNAIRVVSKRDNITRLVDAEIRQSDDIAKDEIAIIVELEKMSTEHKRVFTPSPRMESLIDSDGVRHTAVPVCFETVLGGDTKIYRLVPKCIQILQCMQDFLNS